MSTGSHHDARIASNALEEVSMSQEIGRRMSTYGPQLRRFFPYWSCDSRPLHFTFRIDNLTMCRLAACCPKRSAAPFLLVATKTGFWRMCSPLTRASMSTTPHPPLIVHFLPFFQWILHSPHQRCPRSTGILRPPSSTACSVVPLRPA